MKKTNKKLIASNAKINQQLNSNRNEDIQSYNYNQLFHPLQYSNSKTWL